VVAKIYTQEKITVAIPPPIVYNYYCIDYVACTVTGKREGTGDRRHWDKYSYYEIDTSRTVHLLFLRGGHGGTLAGQRLLHRRDDPLSELRGQAFGRTTVHRVTAMARPGSSGACDWQHHQVRGVPAGGHSYAEEDQRRISHRVTHTQHIPPMSRQRSLSDLQHAKLV